MKAHVPIVLLLTSFSGAAAAASPVSENATLEKSTAVDRQTNEPSSDDAYPSSDDAYPSSDDAYPSSDDAYPSSDDAYPSSKKNQQNKSSAVQREESQDLSIDTQVSVIHSPEGFQPSPNFQKQRNRMRFTTRIGYESMSYQATVVAMEMKTIEDNRKIVRADTVDLDFALTFTRVRGSRSGHFSLLFGLYSPFSWGDAAKFTVTPRAHAGLGLGLALELVKFEGQFRYHHPLVEKNSSTIDSVKVTFQPGTYWHSEAQLRITAFPLAEPFLDAGAYYLRSSQYDTTMTTRKIPAAELYYLRYGVDISTPLDILSVQLAVTRPIEQPDIVSYVMTTGRRTPEALMKEYSLGLNVRI